MYLCLRRITLSFLAVFGAYWLYVLVAVPLIEPQVKRAAQEPIGGDGELERTRQRYRNQLLGLFPDDAWELGDPKVVETDQGLFLFQNYETATGGRLDVKPCTVVLYASASKRAGGKPTGRPIVMFVPGGAELQFDGESDTTRGEFGRLQSGVLRGDITIQAPESFAGAADEIQIRTRDIQISEPKIWTPHRVDFRFGNSRGSGQDLVILLATPNRKRGKTGFAPTIGGVQSLELAHIDKVHLQLGRGEPADAAAPDANTPTLPLAVRAGKALFQGPANSPLEIMCRGAFRFDFFDQVASFAEQVDVVRLAGGVSDQLNCELLKVYFATRGDTNAPPAPAQAAGGSDKSLASSIVRIVATGHPVVLRAPSIAATAHAEYLEYNLQTRRILLRVEDDVKSQQPQAATLHYGPYEIAAPVVEYEMPEDPRRLGRAWAAGPGLVAGQLGGKNPQPFTATWGKELHIRPQDDQHVISLTDGATIRYGESHRFTADNLHLWLNEVPSGDELATKTNSEIPDAIEPADVANATDPTDTAAVGDANALAAAPPTTLIPDRILAQGNVNADSPQMAAKTNRLEVWFRAASGDALAPLPNRPAATPVSRQKQPTQPLAHNSAAPPPLHKLEVSGEVIRVQMLLLERRPEVDEITIEGQVRLVEIPTGPAALADDQPLTITGDALQAQDVSSGHAAVAVTGQPALVAAHGVSISGGSVQLRQADNKIWIDGPGEMLLPPPSRQQPGGQRLYENPQLVAASRQKTPPISVEWHDRLIFDGLTAQFHGRIHVRGKHQLDSGDTMNLFMSGERLDVALTQRVDFSHPPRDLALPLPPAVATPKNVGPSGAARAAIDVRQLTFVGTVYLENQTFRDREQVAFDRLWIDNLSLDQTTGRIHGDSPRGNTGKCRRVQLEQGSPAATDASGASRPAKPPRLMSLLVTFRGSFEGNLHSHQVEFLDQVTTWYSPVNDWTDDSPPPSPSELGPDGVLLSCDRMAVAEMGGYTPGQRPVELTATGNVSVTGQRFKARGGRLSYARGKDLLILDGDARGAAELWQLPAPAGKKPDAIARHIEYWPQTGAINVTGVKSIEITPPRNPLDRTAKPPQPKTR